MEKTPADHFPESGLKRRPHADQSPYSPPPECGWIRQPVWISDGGSRLLPTALLLFESFCGLLPAMQAVVTVGQRPSR
jgi:hypothetical protein